MSQLFQIISKHLPSSHGYADDTQLYLSFSPDSPVVQDQAIQIISNCIDEVRAWLVSRKLMFNDFNDTKTEFLIIGTRQQLQSRTKPSATLVTFYQNCQTCHKPKKIPPCPSKSMLSVGGFADRCFRDMNNIVRRRKGGGCFET